MIDIVGQVEAARFLAGLDQDHAARCGTCSRKAISALNAPNIA
jgi:hypothetical protein